MSDWQPIETAPKDGTCFIAWHGATPVGGYELHKWGAPPGHCEHFMRADGRPSFSDPTDWMPLPPPPQASDASPAVSDDEMVEMVGNAIFEAWWQWDGLDKAVLKQLVGHAALAAMRNT